MIAEKSLKNYCGKQRFSLPNTQNFVIFLINVGIGKEAPKNPSSRREKKPPCRDVGGFFKVYSTFANCQNVVTPFWFI